MSKFANICIAIVLVLLSIFIYLFCFSNAPQQKIITWGVDFSQLQVQNLELDWKEVYLAMLSDLGVKNIKLHTQWDFAQVASNQYDFSDIDWQIQKAGEYGAKVVYVVGMKTGRWPECHIPDWASDMSKQDQQNLILQYVAQVVNRYKDNSTISIWQAENEPLFVFGECPWYDKKFLEKEVALIKSLDPSRSVMISDSGEQSFWLKVASIGDVVGVTTYRKVWFPIIGEFGFYVSFPLSPGSYWIKSQLIQLIFDKKVIGVELQMEPWSAKLLRDTSLEEQSKTMNLNQFKANIEYAKNTGLDQFYLWGVEWWYWLKKTQNRPEIWQEAKSLF